MEIIDLTTDEANDPNAKKLFWNGFVALTFNKWNHHLLPGCQLTFEQILGQSSEIKCIILSSFCFDEMWLFPKLSKIKHVYLISHPDTSERRATSQNFVHRHWYLNALFLFALKACRSNIAIIYPPFSRFPNYGVMHSKFMLIQYKDRLRFVVTTANLMPYDYEDVQNVMKISAIIDIYL